MIFLIEYDRPKGGIITFLPFSDSDRSKAESKRLEIELELNRKSIGHEVVLLEAATEKDLRLTHRRYFEDPGEIGDSMGSSSFGS
jgi:hypothetical protein